MKIIDIFCDASIDTTRKVACGGCYIVMQESGNISYIGRKLVIQTNATNNSSEILAIYTGVASALNLRSMFPDAVFRLFSDSKISIYGLKDWMKNWVANMRPDGTLISSSGQQVINQQRFINIYNLIVENNLKIEFYHQRGHVNDGKVSLEKARIQFIKANKVSPENLGVNIKILSNYNDAIDKATREALYMYLNNGVFAPDTMMDLIEPIKYYIRAEDIHMYITNINKVSVVSRHDFKGGYNQ